MGAKMTPTMKKSGRTVFGVRMGLQAGQWLGAGVADLPLSVFCTYCHAFKRCCRNAVSVSSSAFFAFCARWLRWPETHSEVGGSSSSLSRRAMGPGLRWSRRAAPVLSATWWWLWAGGSIHAIPCRQKGVWSRNMDGDAGAGAAR